MPRTLAGLSAPNDLFIDGGWVSATSGEMMAVFDPGTATEMTRVAAGGADDIDRAVLAARAALRGPWQVAEPHERSAVLRAMGDLMRAEYERFATLEVLDSGKPYPEAEGDLDEIIRMLDYYAGVADKLEAASIPLGRGHLGFTVHEPIGVVGLIVPWNYPLHTAVRGIAPALAAGCTLVVKPAETTPLTTLAFAELATKAGLPAGVLNVVSGFGPTAGAALSAHPGVDHVTFTGSIATGTAVMQAAAQNVTGVTLELGGKSPVVVMADADLGAAVEGAISAVFFNAGQVCSAGSRLIVDAAVHDEVVSRVVEGAKAMSIGHGLGSDDGPDGRSYPDVGAINSQVQLERITGHVDAAKSRGLDLLCGGSVTTDPATGAGWFFEPTVFDRVPLQDDACQQEIFGPVLTVQVVDGYDEALAGANGTSYGLQAGIYTSDLSTGLRFARDAEAGRITVNDYWAGGIELPFGGNGQSGFGREHGVEAVRTYTRTKSVGIGIGD